MVSAVVRAPPEACFHVRGLRRHVCGLLCMLASAEHTRGTQLGSRGRALCDCQMASILMGNCQVARCWAVHCLCLWQKSVIALSTVSIPA